MVAWLSSKPESFDPASIETVGDLIKNVYAIDQFAEIIDAWSGEKYKLMLVVANMKQKIHFLCVQQTEMKRLARLLL